MEWMDGLRNGIKMMYVWNQQRRNIQENSPCYHEMSVRMKTDGIKNGGVEKPVQKKKSNIVTMMMIDETKLILKFNY